MPEADPPCLLILSTCATKEDAARIARHLVEEKLAACVSIVPAIESIYRWEGLIHHDEEFLLLIKTLATEFPAVESRLAALHPYSTPEILALPIHAGSQPYLTWLREQIQV